MNGESVINSTLNINNLRVNVMKLIQACHLMTRENIQPSNSASQKFMYGDHRFL